MSNTLKTQKKGQQRRKRSDPHGETTSMNLPYFASSSDTRKANRTNNINNVAGHDETSRFIHDDGHYDHADLGTDATPERVTRGWNYSQLADCAYQVKQLPEGARTVLAFLVKAADSNVDSPNYRSVSRSVGWLQNKTLQSERTVRRHLRRIERSGILTLKTIGNNRDGNCANVWLLNPEQLAVLSKEARDAWANRKTPYDLAMESLRADVLATEEQSQAILAEHGMACAVRTTATDTPPKSTRRRHHTKATNPRLGLHHAVADHREQHDLGDWPDVDHDVYDDPCHDTSDPHAGQVGPPAAPSDPLSNVLFPLENPCVEEDDQYCSHLHHDLEDDQRAGAHVRAYDKYPVDTDEESTGNVEEDSANVVSLSNNVVFDSYLDDLLANGDVDVQVATADTTTPTATADAQDQEQDLEGVVEQNSSDTATNTPHITVSKHVTTTQTATKQAKHEATHTQTNTIKKTTKTEATDKRGKPTPSCGAPSHERDTAVLAQRAPKNTTQARQWSASLYRLATAHHDPVAATVALHIASSWDGLAQWAASTTDSAATMAKASSEHGALTMRFAVPVGDVIERVCEAWWRAESEHDSDVCPNIDTLEHAVATWFNERAIDSIHAPMPRGEIHGRLAKYVAQAYRAEATGDSSFLPADKREAWERRRWVRQNNRGHRTEKWCFEVPEDPGEWLLGWASANCIESTTVLDLWAQFRREHIEQLAQSWRMLFVLWWKARCVS